MSRRPHGVWRTLCRTWAGVIVVAAMFACREKTADCSGVSETEVAETGSFDTGSTSQMCVIVTMDASDALARKYWGSLKRTGNNILIIQHNPETDVDCAYGNSARILVQHVSLNKSYLFSVPSGLACGAGEAFTYDDSTNMEVNCYGQTGVLDVPEDGSINATIQVTCAESTLGHED